MLNNIYFILGGIVVTLQYSICAILGGLCLGTLLAVCKISNRTFIRILAHMYTSIFRGTPLLVQLSIIYFAMPGIMGLKLDVFTSGIIAFSLNSAAYVSEIIRAGFNSINKGQFEAATALSIGRYSTIKDIIIPQAIRNILPSLINEFISLIKESAIISIFGELDIMRRAQLVSAETYNYFSPLMIAGACYYILVFLFSQLAFFIEKKIKL